MRQILLHGKIDMNCYFIEHNKKCYIVDPGYEKERVVEYVKNNELEVLGILLTHGHIDHIGAIDVFDVPVFIHEREYDVLVDNYIHAKALFGVAMKYRMEDINYVKFNINQKFYIDNEEIKVIYTPGHTIGGVCYLFKKDLYTGDTLFKGTVGKWIFKTGNIEEMKKSIFYLLEHLENNIKVYPGHGESTTIGDEKINNKYYLQWKQNKLD